MSSYISAEIRRLVIERAGNCCEYCLLNRQYRLFNFEIDHVIAEKHGGLTESDNLCLSCPECNGYKGSDIASIDYETGQLTFLFNPRQHNWDHHFQLDNVIIRPRTPEGRVTVALLRLNDLDRLSERNEMLEIGNYPCRKNSR